MKLEGGPLQELPIKEIKESFRKCPRQTFVERATCSYNLTSYTKYQLFVSSLQKEEVVFAMENLVIQQTPRNKWSRGYLLPLTHQAGGLVLSLCPEDPHHGSRPPTAMWSHSSKSRSMMISARSLRCWCWLTPGLRGRISRQQQSDSAEAQVIFSIFRGNRN